jgi:hypothetical protein
MELLLDGSIKITSKTTGVTESQPNSQLFPNNSKFFHVMEANADKQIFVHCAANMRVSAFIYLYRCLHQGLNDEVARQDLQRIWFPNEVWSNFIQTVLDREYASGDFSPN